MWDVEIQIMGFWGNCAHFYPQTAARGDETGENGYPTMGTCCDVPACLLRPSLYGTLSAQHILAGTCLYHVPPGRRLPCGGGGRAHHRRPLLNIKGTQSRNSPDTAEAASGLFVSRCLLQDGPPVGGGNHFGVPGQIAGPDLGFGAGPLGLPGSQLLVRHLQSDGVVGDIDGN